MLKWILRFFYIMIISVATLYVYGSANYGRLEEYYAKYMADEIDNDAVYLKGINTLMNLEYHQENAIYTSPESTDTEHIKVSVYAIGIKNDGKYYDGMMVFVNELEIYEDGKLVENPIIKITADLSDKTYKFNDELTDTPYVVYDSTKAFPYSYAPTLFLVYAEDYLLIPDTENYATVNRISVSYSNGEINEEGQYVFNPTLLFAGANEEVSEAAYNKAINLNLNESSFRLTETFGDELSLDEIETLNLNTERGSLKEFNGVIVKTMLIYGLIVLALTYVLFFHKFVMAKIRNKRESSQTVVQKEPGKEQVAIFQDIDYSEEDKKKKK